MPYKNPEDRREYERKRREIRRLLKNDPAAAAAKQKELQDEQAARRKNPPATTAAAPTYRRKKSRNPDTEARKRFEANRSRGKRTCGEEACTTVLSVYNTEDYCAVHAPARNRNAKQFL